MSKDFKKIIELIKAGKMEKTLTIGHVDYYEVEKTPYSFRFYALFEEESNLGVSREILTEMLYDLRYKEYYIKRNGREVSFNIKNIDTVVPRVTMGSKYGPVGSIFNRKQGMEMFFKMVEVEENEGMYNEMIEVIGSLGNEQLNMASRALIRLMISYNKLELLYKAGIDISIVQSVGVRDRIEEASKNNKGKLHQVLGLTKSQLKLALEFSSKRPVNEHYKHYIRPITIRYIDELDKKDIDMFRMFRTTIKNLEEKYLTDRMDEFIEVYGGLDDFLYSKVGRRDWVTNFYNLITQFNHPNPKKLLEYLLFECYLSQGLSFRGAIQVYTDYYRMCTDMQYVKFDRYPKYLKTYHDIVARNYNLVKDEVTSRKFKEATESYKGLEDEVKGYKLIVPNDSDDLVYEGNLLQQCVASYVKNVANNKTRILFLREEEKEDEPLVTVEIKEDKVVQARGHSNRVIYPEELEALKSFAKRKELEVKI